jgi:hypothetical protein
MKLCGLFITLFFILNLYASPLIFKSKKEISTNEKTLVELGEFETEKFRQVRISVSVEGGNIDYESKDNFQYFISVEGLENGEVILLQDKYNSLNLSAIIETPPTKMRVRAWGKGIFRLYVWAD